MGKNQKLKQERNKILKRLSLLSRIGLPPREDLLNHPAAGILVGIYTESAGRFVEPMAEEITPDTLRASIRAALTFLDELFARLPANLDFQGVGPSRIQCQKGCNFCCTIRVTTSAPVVLALAYYLRRKLNADDITAVIRRCQEHVTAGASLSALDQVLVSRMCPLNINGACIGYAYRPFGCRAYHSFDVDKCREDMESEVKDLMVPQDPERLGLHSLVLQSVLASTKCLGLATEELELIPALLIALTEPDADRRYIAGEDVFRDACRPDVRQAQLYDMHKRGLIPLPQSGISALSRTDYR